MAKKKYQYILTTSEEMLNDEITHDLYGWVAARLVRVEVTGTCQYTLTFTEEIWPRKLADSMLTWLHEHVLTITDLVRPEGHKSYGPVYHVSDGLDNVPLAEQGIRTFEVELWHVEGSKENWHRIFVVGVLAEHTQEALRRVAEEYSGVVRQILPNYDACIVDESLVWDAHRKVEVNV